ncbi:MAG: hypothetical protein K2F87_02785 [Muribaculaceae bacterium]|nr:hypothetical protein [Muribaculaceae bacterium]
MSNKGLKINVTGTIQNMKAGDVVELPAKEVNLKSVRVVCSVANRFSRTLRYSIEHNDSVIRVRCYAIEGARL